MAPNKPQSGAMVVVRRLAGLALAGSAALASAQATPPGPTPPKVPTARNTEWSSLSQGQQQALKPLKGQWHEIDPARRAKWMEVAARYPTMSADERSRLQERMAEWSRMSPSERSQARLSFQMAKQVPAEQRQARWEAYQALAPEQREALARAGAASAATGTVPSQASARQPSAPVKPVAPTVVQVKPGATTTLMNAPPKALTQRPPDAPRIAATPSTVDSATLLPKRGPQGAPQRAATASRPASAP